MSGFCCFSDIQTCSVYDLPRYLSPDRVQFRDSHLSHLYVIISKSKHQLIPAGAGVGHSGPGALS